MRKSLFFCEKELLPHSALALSLSCSPFSLFSWTDLSPVYQTLYICCLSYGQVVKTFTSKPTVEIS